MQVHDYFMELRRVLLKDEIQSELRGGGRFVVMENGEEVCLVAPTGEVLLNPVFTHDEQAGALYQKVTSVADKVREYMEAYEQGVEFNQGYHLASACNHTVLGVKKAVNGYLFVTWNQDPDGGFSNGCYTNVYENAKEDFVRLSGLLPPEKLFTECQLVELSRCVADTLEGGYRISQEQERMLMALQEQLKNAVPDYQQLLRESVRQDQAQQAEPTGRMEWGDISI